MDYKYAEYICTIIDILYIIVLIIIVCLCLIAHIYDYVCMKNNVVSKYKKTQ